VPIVVVKDKKRLSSRDSEKDVYSIILHNEGLEYEVGDVLKIYPQNSNELLDEMKKFYKDIDFTNYDLRLTSTKMLKVIADRSEHIKELLKPMNFVKRQEFMLNNSIPEVIRGFGQLDEEVLLNNLLKMRPRSYSIASSMKEHPNEIHLLVSLTKFKTKRGEEKGTASSFLIDTMDVGSSFRAEVGKKEHFRPPSDEKDIIMIGPGTGIAPFIGFLMERKNSKGLNWLFFGERSRKNEFYYEDLLTDLQREGKLRLDLAFSRDQEEKVYVQHKIKENEGEIREIIAKGGHIYLCGDAKKMAKSVESVLKEILNKKASSECELAKMKMEKRYLTDVY
tara:strand:- start:17944 stop:18951 length:1008 start_codon:yes stop_codon:yes gene_type:complete